MKKPDKPLFTMKMMIRHIARRVASLLLTVGIATTLMAQTDDEKPVLADLSTLPTDSVVEPPHAYNIYVTTRSYDDNIYIRWAPDEYVPWRTLNYWGYDVVRVWQDKDVIEMDTLARVKPLSLEQFIEAFEANDTLAAAAAEIIYGKRTEIGNTEAHPESMQSIVELYEEQQMVYSYAMLIAEQRRDIAVAMGLAFEDRTARANRVYDYVIAPVAPDSVLRINQYVTRADKLGTWKPERYTTTITDSIQPPANVLLKWQRTQQFTAFSIERRCVSRGGEWTTLNDKPYIMMLQAEEYEDGYNRYVDEMVQPGTYEYRIKGYDMFGDLSAPCASHRVDMPDLMPPAAPLIKYIEIVRHEESPRIDARIYIQKDTIEEDLMGYIPFYQNESYQGNIGQTLLDSVAQQLSAEQKRLLEEGRMMPLVTEPLPPADTVLMVNVTGLESGKVIVVATDTALNMTHSMPIPIHIADLNPPSPPSRLRSAMSLDGVLMLTWTPSPEVDIEGYEIYWANQPSQVFMQVGDFYSNETLYVDTLPLTTAEPYRYFYIKARDYAGNGSGPSDTLQVERPTNIKPQPCRVDSLWMTTQTVNMLWYPSPEPDVLRYYVYRRMQGDEEWKMIQTLTPDSLTDNRLYIVDRPEPHMTKRYYYAIETINRSGLSSGMSFATSFLFKGEVVLPIEIKLFGQYNEEIHKVQLAWEISGLTEAVAKDAYLVISRKRSTDEFFRFLKSVSVNDAHTIDNGLRPGEAAEYEIRLRTNEGRFSPYSNSITVENTDTPDEQPKEDVQ